MTEPTQSRYIIYARGSKQEKAEEKGLYSDLLIAVESAKKLVGYYLEVYLVDNVTGKELGRWGK